jgi:hypothetical protein
LPLLSVWVLRSVEVALFLTITVAFGNTAPLESVTVPWTVAVDWANAEEVARRAATSTKKIAIRLLSILTSEEDGRLLREGEQTS